MVITSKLLVIVDVWTFVVVVARGVVEVAMADEVLLLLLGDVDINIIVVSATATAAVVDDTDDDCTSMSDDNVSS